MTEPKRKITDEARAAETWLINYWGRVKAADRKHDERKARLVQELIDYTDTLPDDVRKMLVAGGVIEEDGA